MTKFRFHNKKKKGAAALIIAAILALLFTGCPNSVGGSGSGGSGSVSLILKPGTNMVMVGVTTSDGTPVTVEGCSETSLTSTINYAQTALNPTGTTVILKGNITALDCSGFSVGNNNITELNLQGLSNLHALDCRNNQLTSLNVQGCTALEWLHCNDNQLDAQAFIQLLTGLPARSPSDDAKCILFSEGHPGEGNHTDFTAPAELAAAFNDAKNNKHWKLYKRGLYGAEEWVH